MKRKMIKNTRETTSTKIIEKDSEVTI